MCARVVLCIRFHFFTFFFAFAGFVCIKENDIISWAQQFSKWTQKYCFFFFWGILWWMYNVSVKSASVETFSIQNVNKNLILDYIKKFFLLLSVLFFSLLLLWKLLVLNGVQCTRDMICIEQKIIFVSLFVCYFCFVLHFHSLVLTSWAVCYFCCIFLPPLKWL